MYHLVGIYTGESNPVREWFRDLMLTMGISFYGSPKGLATKAGVWDRGIADRNGAVYPHHAVVETNDGVEWFCSGLLRIGVTVQGKRSVVWCPKCLQILDKESDNPHLKLLKFPDKSA